MESCRSIHCLSSNPLLTRDWKKLSSPHLKPGERGFKRTILGVLEREVLGSGIWCELANGRAPGKGLFPVQHVHLKENVGLLEKDRAEEDFHLGVRDPSKMRLQV